MSDTRQDAFGALDAALADVEAKRLEVLSAEAAVKELVAQASAALDRQEDLGPYRHQLAEGRRAADRLQLDLQEALGKATRAAAEVTMLTQATLRGQLVKSREVWRSLMH